MQPSKYQQAVYDFVVDPGGGSAIVEAVAGSGKTTTIVHAAGLLPRGEPAVFLAFNRSIADELGDRLPTQVSARTFHSCGMAAWSSYLTGRVNVDGEKVRRLIGDVLGQYPEKSDEWWILAKVQAPARRLVSLAQSVGLVPKECEDVAPRGLVEDATEAWLALVEHHDVQCDDVPTAIELAREVLVRAIQDALETGRISFDDMIYMPVVCGAAFKRYAWVFVDEAQDVSDLQREMLRGMLAPGGRLVAVGDPHQAIYGWRGASSESLDLIAKEFGCRRLPLSISYRCPRAVVAEAQKYVAHIEPHDGAPEGKVEHRASWSAVDLKPKDAILCRNVAPLMAQCFRLIRSGVACWVRGRDVGAGLVALVKSMRAGGSVDALRSKLEAHLGSETSRLLQAGKDEQAAALEDRVLSILAVADHAGVKTVDALVGRIEALFKDHGRGVQLATVHKAKGLEWERVWLLDRATRMPSRWARLDWQRQQEANLIYVAVTRAKAELVDVDSGGWRD